MSRKSHWEDVYSSKSAQQVSWYQSQASVSQNMIQSVLPRLSSSIIDVGGGASTLVDGLIEAGYQNITVFDISGEALAVAQRRLAQKTEAVTWMEGDITQASLPEQTFDIWHDRAVFHFLVDQTDRDTYVSQAIRAVKPGGYVIIATFAPDGPTQCSGLPVRRYSVDELQAELGPTFTLVSQADEYHTTPGGNSQHFIYGLFRLDR